MAWLKEPEDDKNQNQNKAGKKPIAFKKNHSKAVIMLV